MGFRIFPYVALVHKTPVRRTINISCSGQVPRHSCFFLGNGAKRSIRDFHIFRQHSYSESEGGRGRGGGVGHGRGDDGGSSDGSFGGSFGG